MNKSPKQKFQFEREYSLRGQLGYISSILGCILGPYGRRKVCITELERRQLKCIVADLNIILQDFKKNTAILKKEL